MEFIPKEPADQPMTVSQVKAGLTKYNSAYGKDFSDEEWRRITYRLCALARLIWRITNRELAEEQRAKTQGGHRPGKRDT